MSTFINVNVDLQGILNRLKEQQGAQRQAQLEKEKNQTFEEQVAEATRQFEQQQLRGFRSTPATRQQGRALRRDELAAWRGGCRPGADLLPGGAFINPAGFIHADPELYTQFRIDTSSDFTVITTDFLGDCTVDRSQVYLDTYGWPKYYPDLASRDPVINPPTGEWIFIGRVKYFSVALIKQAVYGNEFFDRCGDAIWYHEITREVPASVGQEPPVLEVITRILLQMDSSATNKDGITRMAPPLYTFSTVDGSIGVPAKCYWINGVAQYS